MYVKNYKARTYTTIHITLERQILFRLNDDTHEQDKYCGKWKYRVSYISR